MTDVVTTLRIALKTDLDNHILVFF